MDTENTMNTDASTKSTYRVIEAGPGLEASLNELRDEGYVIVQTGLADQVVMMLATEQVKQGIEVALASQKQILSGAEEMFKDMHERD